MKPISEGRRGGLYRARDGMIFGVCKGVAQYLDISVFWTRIIALGFLFFTGIWPVVGVYILAALLMKLEPVMPVHSDEDLEFYNSYMSSRGMALKRVKRKFDGLDQRIQRLEDIVTRREYDWERRLNG
jgi:phage shock protein C